MLYDLNVKYVIHFCEYFKFIKPYLLMFSENLPTVMSPPASDSSRSKKKRVKQKSTVSSQLLKEKTKFDNQKRRMKEISLRLENKEYDELLLAKNRDKVKRLVR